MDNFNEKVVLITGGSSGIGKATAEKFAKENAKVFICSRNEEKLHAVKNDFIKNGLSIEVISGDISEVAQCEKMIHQVISKSNQLDILVNCAGTHIEGKSDTMTEEMWNTVMDTNLKGTFFMIRYAIPFLEKTQGCIVNVSSDAGLVGNSETALYCASKGGVTLLTKALAVELQARGIRVNAICPSEVDTPMLDAYIDEVGISKEECLIQTLQHYPAGANRFIQPEEVAESIVFLASPKTKAINGACLSIDFGLTAGY